jgi:hypothetical protein
MTDFSRHTPRRGALRTAVGLTLALALGTVLAQEVRDPPKAKQQDFDRRNLSGTWDRYPLPLDAQRDASVVPPPPDIPPPPLRPEFKAAYDAERKKVDEANARGEPIANNYTHCLPDGMPAMMMAMFPMEVLQTRGQVTIIQEAFNQVRRIYLEGKLPAIDDAEPGFWGHSVGHWEGDTLLVETVGIKEYVRFRNTPHSAEMRISERIRMVTPDFFENQVTVTDPAYLARPWQWKWVYQRKPAYKMFEYVCEENREFADPVTGAQRMKVGAP